MLKTQIKISFWVVVGASAFLWNSSTLLAEPGGARARNQVLPNQTAAAQPRPVAPRSFDELARLHNSFLTEVAAKADAENAKVNVSEMAPVIAIEEAMEKLYPQQATAQVESNYKKAFNVKSDSSAPASYRSQFQDVCVDGKPDSGFGSLLSQATDSTSGHSSGSSSGGSVPENCKKLTQEVQRLTSNFVPPEVTGDSNESAANNEGEEDKEKTAKNEEGEDDDEDEGSDRDDIEKALERERLAQALRGIRPEEEQGEEGGGGSGSGEGSGGEGSGSGSGSGGESGGKPPKIPKNKNDGLAELLKNKNNGNDNSNLLKQLAQNAGKSEKKKEKEKPKNIFGSLSSTSKKKNNDDDDLFKTPKEDTPPADAFAEAAAPEVTTSVPGVMAPPAGGTFFGGNNGFGGGGFGAGGAGGPGAVVGNVTSTGAANLPALATLGSEGIGRDSAANYTIPKVSVPSGSGYSGGGAGGVEGGEEGLEGESLTAAGYAASGAYRRRRNPSGARLGDIAQSDESNWLFNAIPRYLNGTICSFPKGKRPAICGHERTPRLGPLLTITGPDNPT